MAPAGKAEQALRRQKEARQKKVLFVLAPLLLALLAWQGPGMLKAFTGGDTPPPAPPQPTATTAAPDPSAAAAPSTAGADPAAAPTAAGQLPDADEPSVPGAGQLIGFDRFVGKDPFRQQVAAKAANDDGGSAKDDGKDDDPSTAPGVTPPAVPGGNDGGNDSGNGNVFNTATLAVNGVEEVVSAGASFPESDPVFVLVSIGSSSVKIGLVSGEFSNGAKTITIKRGKSATLISQPDGFRFTIRLVDLGEPPA